MSDGQYLHGFSEKEQARLYEQALFLAPFVYPYVDFSSAQHIVEIGSGVGAQTSILLKKYPQLKISCVDASSAQIKKAKENLAEPISAGRVEISLGDASRLTFSDCAFDGVYICWLLEHVEKPLEVLKEAHRVIQSGSTIYLNEVLNSSFLIEDSFVNIKKYWQAYNELQIKMKGDPYIGARLGNLLLAAGFSRIQTHFVELHFDQRNLKQRDLFVKYMEELVTSGADQLLSAKCIDKSLLQGVRQEFSRFYQDKAIPFYFGFIRASAVK